MTCQAVTPVYDVPVFALNVAFENLRAALETDAFDRGTRERVLAGLIALMDQEAQEIARRKADMEQSVREESRRALEIEDNEILTAHIEGLRKEIDQHGRGIVECERLRDFAAQRYESVFFTSWILTENSRRTNRADQPPRSPEPAIWDDPIEDDDAEPDGPLVEFED